MTRKFNLSIFILKMVESICYFVPFCIVEEYWKYQQSSVYHGIAHMEHQYNISIFELGTFLGNHLANLLFCAALLSTGVYLLKAIKQKSVIRNKEWIVAIAHTAILVVFLVYVCAIATVQEISYQFTYSLGLLSFVIIALNFIAAGLAIFIKFGKGDVYTALNKKFGKNPNNGSKAALDDLLGYKELLDLGVLTQEEFEDKKKQILGS